MKLCSKNDLIVSVILGLLAFYCVQYVTTRFTLGIDSQMITSIPGLRVALIDHQNKDLEKGSIYAFSVEGLEPLFKDGEIFVKYLEGKAGDTVLIDDHVHVNGVIKGLGAPLAGILKVSEETFHRNFAIPKNELFFLGTAKESLDSRYFGTVSENRIIGKVYPLWR